MSKETLYHLTRVDTSGVLQLLTVNGWWSVRTVINHGLEVMSYNEENARTEAELRNLQSPLPIVIYAIGDNFFEF